jgi:hypothetical protein
MRLLTKSFESPVSSTSEDLLDRWRLAKDVYSIIQGTPKDWSCRIGVYGKWGEGKTSLLRFVETQADADGLISFWVNPSQAESSDDLWRIVLEAFIEALDREDLLVDEVRAWRVSFLVQKTAPLDRLAESNQYAKALVGFGRAAIKEWLRPDGAQISKIRDKLHANKVVVFIDDLDRADPKLVPALLLGLRDFLDLPGFCFVVAFDDEIVSKTLIRVNSAWGDGKAFIDKILDFSFSLPTPKDDQRLALMKHLVKDLCPWMNIEVLEQNADLLPDTPRRLKMLIRNLMTLASQVKRHDASEIQWFDFLMGQLLRVEAPGFLDGFLMGENVELLQIGAFLPRKQGGPSFDERLATAVEKSGILETAIQSRLLRLLRVWGERRAFEGSKNFTYYAGFGVTHREITQREFEDLIDGYREAQDRGSLETELAEHTARVNSPITEVAQEFLRLALEARAAYLEDAADAEVEADTIHFLAQAHDCLKILGDILEHPTSVFSLTREVGRSLMQQVVGQSLRWIHFDAPVYQATRCEERELLKVLAAGSLVPGLDWLDFLLPWSDPTLYLTGEGRIAAAALIDELLGIVESRVATEALDLFSKDGLNLSSPRATNVARFCFFDPKSPVWQDAGRFRFFETLKGGVRNRAIRHNAFELLGCLSWSRLRDGFVGNPDEMTQVLLLPGVAEALWAASIAQQVQYRFQQQLIEVRRAVIDKGVEGDCLPIPEWLSRRVAELNSSSSPADASRRINS